MNRKREVTAEISWGFGLKGVGFRAGGEGHWLFLARIAAGAAGAAADSLLTNDPLPIYCGCPGNLNHEHLPFRPVFDAGYYQPMGDLAEVV
jgi:hypothetical protein